MPVLLICAPLILGHIRYPAGIVIEGVEPTGSPEVKPVDDEDFFTSWDKPTISRSASAPTSKPTTPAISRSVTPVDPASQASPPVGSRTVTSSTLRATSNAAGAVSGGRRLGGTSRLTSTGASSGSIGSKKGKLGGLGGVKKAAAVDFAEAERKAAEEAKRNEQLGYDRLQEEKEERAKENEKSPDGQVNRNPGSTDTAPQMSSPDAKPTASPAQLERLGMGSKRYAFGSLPAAGVATAAASTRSK